MYTLILGTEDELQEMLEIAKPPLESTVKLVPLRELAERVTKDHYTEDWGALDTLVQLGVEYRPTVDFYGIYKTLTDYLDDAGAVEHLEAVVGGECDSLPLVMVAGVVGVPLYVNQIRFNINRALRDQVVVRGKVKLGDFYALDLPKDSPVFSPADVFNEGDVGRPLARFDIFRAIALSRSMTNMVTRELLDPEMKAMLLEHHSAETCVPPHLQDTQF